MSTREQLTAAHVGVKQPALLFASEPSSFACLASSTLPQIRHRSRSGYVVDALPEREICLLAEMHAYSELAILYYTP